jgi:hypothetical protein
MTAAQATLGEYARPATFAELTPAERDIYESVERGDMGVREYQRQQGWDSPGTASNLLERARRKVEAGPEGSEP